MLKYYKHQHEFLQSSYVCSEKCYTHNLTWLHQNPTDPMYSIKYVIINYSFLLSLIAIIPSLVQPCGPLHSICKWPAGTWESSARQGNSDLRNTTHPNKNDYRRENSNECRRCLLYHHCHWGPAGRTCFAPSRKLPQTAWGRSCERPLQTPGQMGRPAKTEWLVGRRRWLPAPWAPAVHIYFGPRRISDLLWE